MVRPSIVSVADGGFEALGARVLFLYFPVLGWAVVVVVSFDGYADVR